MTEPATDVIARLHRPATDSGFQVLCIGEAMVEVALVPDSNQASIGVAGDTLNTAIYLKRAASTSATVGFCTAVGEDAFSDRVVQFIANEQVDTVAIGRIANCVPGLYAITTDKNGERTFTYWRQQSAARLLFQPESNVRFDVLDNYDLVYLSGITLAILPASVVDELIDALARLRQDTRVLVAFDPNYRPALWSSNSEARRLIDRMWSVTDIALPSLDDLMALHDFSSESQTVDYLHNCGVQFGVLKRGESGPFCLSSASSPELPKGKVEVVDTTAAGDSFNGAYLAALIKGMQQNAAMQRGHHCALQVISERGAIVPTIHN